MLNAEGESVSREADTPTEVASLTKIMTAMVVLEHRNLDEQVEITEEILTGLEEFSVIGLRTGQVATVEDLLYALMLPSAGDAAQALAISTSGSIEEFVREMNTEAARIGLKNTHFSNPVGFDAGTSATGGGATEDLAGSENPMTDNMEGRNYSTPRDVAMMLRVALQNERFREIFESYERELPSVGLVARKTFQPTGAIKGGKTGFTNAAGRCLASTAEIEGTEYILVTVGAPAESTEHVADAEKIYRAVEENYEPVRLVKAGDIIARVPVEGSPVKMLEFRAGSDIMRAMPNDFQAEEIEYSFEGWKGRTAVRRDTPTGESFGGVTASYNGEVLYNVGLTIWKDCHDGSQGQYCVEMPRFYNYGWLGLGLFATVFLAALTVREFRKNRRLKIRGAGSAEGSSKGLAENSSRVSAGGLSGAPTSIQKVAPWAGLVMTLISAAVCGFALWDCFRPAGEVEVLRPEIVRLGEAGAAEGPDEAEKPAEEEPSEDKPPAVATGGNCTTEFENLMLINPNFTVGTEFIAGRQGSLISVSQTYGIQEYHAAGNGDNLMMPEAARHLNEMLSAYRAENPGHEMGTYSCFRARGTTCGRLCAATGASDHHTGLTCDLIDLKYGKVLNTDDYSKHLEWQWLKANSYKYGFIDRFPEAWAGGLMSEPLNVDENGSTGLFETWHYRYVGVEVATEIATGKYNGGKYDSLEHYLKATGRVKDLKGGKCRQ